MRAALLTRRDTCRGGVRARVPCKRALASKCHHNAWLWRRNLWEKSTGRPQRREMLRFIVNLHKYVSARARARYHSVRNDRRSLASASNVSNVGNVYPASRWTIRRLQPCRSVSPGSIDGRRFVPRRVHSGLPCSRFRRTDAKRTIHLGGRERGASAISLYSGRAANFPDDKSL